MQVTCEKCGRKLDFSAVLKGEKCPGCGRRFFSSDQKEQGSPRASRGVPGKPGVPRPMWGAFKAIVVSRRSGLSLKTVQPAKEWRFRLAPDTSTPVNSLVGRWWMFEAISNVDKTLTVRPLSPLDRSTLGSPPTQPRFSFDVRDRLAKETKDAERLNAKPLGEGELEQMAKDPLRRPRVVDRISQLARRKNDPFAWAALAMGYRDPTIRVPVGRALSGVGPDKVLAHLRKHPGDWGSEVTAFLEQEVERAKQPPGKAPRNQPTFKDWRERPGWMDD